MHLIDFSMFRSNLFNIIQKMNTKFQSLAAINSRSLKLTRELTILEQTAIFPVDYSIRFN